MPASTEKDHSIFAHCLQGSDAKRAALTLFFVLLAAGTASSQQRRIQLDDLAKVVTVADPQISPDGKSIVCVVSRPNFEEDRNDNQLVLIDVATSAQRVLTFDRNDVGSPRWSPSGDRLAFLAVAPYTKDIKNGTTKLDDNQQIFVMPMAGGGAKKVTNAPNGVEQFAWRPNGKEIAYVTRDDPANQKEIEKHNGSFEVGDNDFLATSAIPSSHIWLASAEDGAGRRLTSGAWSLLKSAIGSPASPISWSPDGKSLAFTSQEHPHTGDADLTTLQILNVETGEIRKLTSHKNFEGYGQFSPDGSKLAYFYRRDGDFNNENEVFVAPVVGGDGIDLTHEIDRNPWRAIWMPDGQSLLIGADDGTQVSLWLQPLQGKARKLSLGEVIPTYDYWTRAWMAPFGHVVWTAITAGALWRVKKDRPFNFQMLDATFWKTFLVPMACHMIWDSPLAMGAASPNLFNYAVTLALGAVAWYVAFGLVQQGLKQVAEEQVRVMKEQQAEVVAAEPLGTATS